MGKQNIIELNGKQYDAVTGAMLSGGRVKATPRRRAAAMGHSGRTIDGFMPQPKPIALQTTTQPAKPVAPVAKKPQTNGKPTTSPTFTDVQRASRTIKAHQPERPKTLMRHVVAKPKVTPKLAIKTAGPAEIMARPTATLAKPLEKKLSVTQVNPHRLARAKHIAKSHHIRHFNARPGQPAGRQASAQSQAKQPAAQRPIVLAQAARPQHTTSAQQRNKSRSIALAHAKQQLISQQKKVDIFEAALAHAVSHEQIPQSRHKSPRRHRRLVNAVAGVGAFLVLGGFLTYLTMPSIELQVASLKAGFHAEMPSYKPAGYALNGGVKSTKGRISMEFRSGDSSYTITQQTSDWNSATLLDQQAERHGEPAQTVQSKGRIIYIYNDTNATWVDGGVRYEIQGNAALSADELVALATSM